MVGKEFGFDEAPGVAKDGYMPRKVTTFAAPQRAVLCEHLVLFGDGGEYRRGDCPHSQRTNSKGVGITSGPYRHHGEYSCAALS